MRPTLFSRLWFVWFAIVVVLVTIPASIMQFITHQFSPDARNFKRWAGLWGRWTIRGVGIRVRVEERMPLDRSHPYVFVSNHQNLLDILALAGWLPYPFGFVAKVELKKVPFLGFAIANSASIFIDRSDPRRSMESLREAGERIREGNSVLVFPEGSRSYASTLLPFKKGAFALAVEAGVPMVPITVVDAYRLMNESKLAIRPGKLHIVVGEPIATEGTRRKDIPDLMEAVQAQMEQSLAGQTLSNT